MAKALNRSIVNLKALVADEVKKLAEKSSDTVQRIQEVTQKVQQAFENISYGA